MDFDEYQDESIIDYDWFENFEMADDGTGIASLTNPLSCLW